MASKYKYGKIKCSICFVTYFALEMGKVEGTILIPSEYKFEKKWPKIKILKENYCILHLLGILPSSRLSCLALITMIMMALPSGIFCTRREFFGLRG